MFAKWTQGRSVVHIRRWLVAAVGLALVAVACGALDLSVWTVGITGIVGTTLAALVAFVVYRPSFSVRTVFVGVTGFAMTIALPAHWFGTTNVRYNREREAYVRLQAMGASFGSRPLLPENRLLRPPDWLVRLVGWGRFHTITEVWLTGGAAHDENPWELVSQFHELEVLQIVDAREVTEADVGHLAGLPKLHWLSLRKTPVSQDALERLSALPLEHFAFDFSLNDSQLATVARMSQLRELRLAKMPITDEGLRAVAELKKLRLLVLRGTQVTDRGLEYLMSLELRQLDVSDTQVTGRGLAGLKTVRALMAYNIQLTDEDLSQFQLQRSLWELGIGDTQVGDSGVAQIAAAYPNLRFLDLQGTRVTNASIQSINQLRRLQALQLARTAVTDEGIAGFSHGRRLWILGVDSTTAEAMAPRPDDWGDYHQMAIDQRYQKGPSVVPRREY